MRSTLQESRRLHEHPGRAPVTTREPTTAWHTVPTDSRWLPESRADPSTPLARSAPECRNQRDTERQQGNSSSQRRGRAIEGDEHSAPHTADDSDDETASTHTALPSNSLPDITTAIQCDGPYSYALGGELAGPVWVLTSPVMPRPCVPRRPVPAPSPAVRTDGSSRSPSRSVAVHRLVAQVIGRAPVSHLTQPDGRE